MRTLALQPLTHEVYAPYGEVIELPPRDNPGRLVNQGFVRRFDQAAEISTLRPHAELNFCLFRCKPRPLDGFTVTLLERHADSTQLFVPLTPARYLVVVALGGEQPDLSTLAAFLVEGPRGISYRPGVWHLPLVSFDHETDFACVVYEDGSARDCDVAMLPDGEHRRIVGA